MSGAILVPAPLASASGTAPAAADTRAAVIKLKSADVHPVDGLSFMCRGKAEQG